MPGLDAGADDYLPKPFALDELLARAACCAAPPTTHRTAKLRLGDLCVDEAARRVWRAERELELTKTEFDLLQLLVRNVGIVLQPLDDLRAHLGLRLRLRFEVPGGLHRLPAPQDRGRGRGAPDPNRARRRVHAARAMTLRGRFAACSPPSPRCRSSWSRWPAISPPIIDSTPILTPSSSATCSWLTDPGGHTAHMLCAQLSAPSFSETNELQAFGGVLAGLPQGRSSASRTSGTGDGLDRCREAPGRHRGTGGPASPRRRRRAPRRCASFQVRRAPGRAYRPGAAHWPGTACRRARGHHRRSRRPGPSRWTGPRTES